MTRAAFYGRWISANGCAECVGLGTTLGLGALAASRMPGLDSSPAMILAAAVGAVLAGTFLEGVVLGACQAWVLSAALPSFSRRRWIGATALGAGVAWTVGMLPSTIIGLVSTPQAQEVAPAPFEPSLALTLLLAAGLGAALGPFLGVPQGRVLRAHGGTVARWVAANSAAWALGMPVIFLATTLIDESSTARQVAVTLGAATLAAGLVVGTVHGRVLLPLVGKARKSEPSPAH